MKKMLVATLLTLSSFAQTSYAQNEMNLARINEFTQSIHVVNLLANINLAVLGMTPTSIIVRYYNGRDQPCWWNKLEYQDDVTIHAGPTQGCVEKVSRIEIEPQLVMERLNNYGAKFSFTVDVTKYSTQVTVVQATSPVYDAKNGLVVTSGTAQAKTQAQFAE